MSETAGNIVALRDGDKIIAVITPTKDGWHTRYINGHDQPAMDASTWSVPASAEVIRCYEHINTLVTLQQAMGEAPTPNAFTKGKGWPPERRAAQAEKKRKAAEATKI